MNPSFQALPADRRRAILQAGYRTFALSPYGKASLAAIAAEAGISKSLLFYYFRDKKEYYLYLFDRALRRVARVSEACAPETGADLFSWVERVVQGRLTLLREQPYLLRFATCAYYETDSRVQPELLRRRQALGALGIAGTLARLDLSALGEPAEAQTLLEMILCLAEGLLQGQESLKPEPLEAAVARFGRMMQSLKAHYTLTDPTGGTVDENTSHSL